MTIHSLHTPGFTHPGIHTWCSHIPSTPLLPPQVDIKEGMRVVFLGKQHYGCTATVLPDLGKGLDKAGGVAKGVKILNETVQL